jgi:hypothetical protein
MDINTGEFWNIALDWHNFLIPSIYNIEATFNKYITTTDLNSIPEQLPMCYSITGTCRHYIIIHKDYRSLFNEVSYESLPDNCKKLLLEKINQIKSKCDVSSAKKLSILTAINTSWENALSSMKEIVKEQALSHEYTLTEALFILHLKPSQSCTSNSAWSNRIKLFLKSSEYKNEDVLFYAECITGAIACVFRHNKKIPANFEFDLIYTNDLSYRFIKNVKKLMQAYKDIFIKEEKKMNSISNNKNKEERNENKIYNPWQEEEKCRLNKD